MPLDSDSAAFVARLRELDLPRYETLTPDEARAAMAAARKAAAVEPPSVGEVREIVIPTNDGALKARLYRPLEAKGALPALVFFHGGGWVLGDLETHDILCRRLCNASGFAVVAVDYRLAPEHKFPTAVDDAIAATQWIAANANSLDVDPACIGVGGDSAGANLAAVVTMTARDAKLPKLRFQVLIYPTVDMSFGHASYGLKEPGLPVLGDTMVWFRDHYLTHAAERDDWRASPLHASNFAALPAAYVLTAGYDPLMDEGHAYGKKLRDAGVAVEHRHYPGQIHGFLTMGVGFPTTQLAISHIAQWLKRQV